MRTFLFDYDGTLCDTQNAIVQSMQSLFHHHRQPVPDDLTLMFLVSSGKTIQESLKALGIKEDLITDWVGIYRRLYAQHENLVRLFDGVFDTLAHLRATGNRLVLVSNKGRKAVEASLNAFKLNEYFDLVIAEEIGLAKKPSPLVFSERILPVFTSAKSEHCIVVGDTVLDLHFAKLLGTHSCFASYGFGNQAECETVGYTHRLDCIADLIAIYP